MIFGVTKYLGKHNYKCDMCYRHEYNDKYQWIGWITKQKLNICVKCAEREIGKKKWKEKNQQLKKS